MDVNNSMATIKNESLNLIESLRECLNKDIKVFLRKEKYYEGVLKGIDTFNNLHLENSREVNDETKETKKTENILVNGGTIAYIEIS